MTFAFKKAYFRRKAIRMYLSFQLIILTDGTMFKRQRFPL